MSDFFSLERSFTRVFKRLNVWSSRVIVLVIGIFKTPALFMAKKTTCTAEQPVMQETVKVLRDSFRLTFNLRRT